MSFRQFGGLNYSAKSNIITNQYSNSGNLGITDTLGQPNSKIVSQSHIDMSANSVLHIGKLYFMDGTVQATAASNTTVATTFPSGIIISGGNITINSTTQGDINFNSNGSINNANTVNASTINATNLHGNIQGFGVSLPNSLIITDSGGNTAFLPTVAPFYLLTVDGANQPYWAAPTLFVGDGQLTLTCSHSTITGTFTANQSGNSTIAIALDATSANTVSTIVARDASGNFSANLITANLAGTATYASNLSLPSSSAGSIPYQTAATTTTFLAATTTTGSMLAYNTTTNAPEWVAPNATTITTTDTNTAGPTPPAIPNGTAIFPVMTSGLGSGQYPYIDYTTTPFSYTPSSGTLTVSSAIDTNAGGTTFNLLNTPTTITFGNAATALTVGANTGTLTIRNPIIVPTQTSVDFLNTVATTINFGGDATALTVGAASGTLTIRNPIIVPTQTSVDFLNTVATTINFGGVATTLNIGAASVTGQVTINSTKPASSATIAALAIAGGIGVGQASYFGSTIQATRYCGTANTTAIPQFAGGSPGSIPVQSATNTTEYLGVGSLGQVLTVTNSNALAWTTPSTTAVTITTTEATTSEPILYPVMAIAAGGSQTPYVDVIGNVLSYTPSTGDFSIGSTSLIASNQLTVKTSGIALGFQAGQTSQGQYALAIGYQAGQTNQGQNAVAIGQQAGQTNQGVNAVAIGSSAGNLSQGSGSVAIGSGAGSNTQGENSVAIGSTAGAISQGGSSVAVGYNAGQSTQGPNAIAIGLNVGLNAQGDSAIAIGRNAGQNTQGENAIAIGQTAGAISQGNNAIAIGQNAGEYTQGPDAVAVGYNAGGTNQGNSAVAIGVSAGENTQQEKAVAIGNNAGNASQGNESVAIGFQAGQGVQGSVSVAIGSYAAQSYQGQNAVAIGQYSGQYTQGKSAVAIGETAGQNSQGQYAVALGYQAGNSTQGENAVAIGLAAGLLSQGQSAVAIGSNAGQNTQGQDAVAIGAYAGHQTQGNFAVAIGNNAGYLTQGDYAIAIGYNAGYTGQKANSIAINATGIQLNAPTISACYIAPIRGSSAATYGGAAGALRGLYYDDTTKEIIANTQAKSFVIDHPLDNTKYLVHVCLEGPESGVYYRGEGEIKNKSSVTILLPDYVDKLATNFTVQLTPIYSGKKIEQLYSSRVQNNSFTVYGENTSFYWLVHGKRGDINVEPYKVHTEVKGTGPYRWI